MYRNFKFVISSVKVENAYPSEYLDGPTIKMLGMLDMLGMYETISCQNMINNINKVY